MYDYLMSEICHEKGVIINHFRLIFPKHMCTLLSNKNLRMTYECIIISLNIHKS